MAGFTTTDAKRASIKRAMNLQDLIRAFYTDGKLIQEFLAIYQSGSDPTLITAINAVYDAAERSELAQMVADVNALLANWETNHKGPLGIAS